VTRELTFNNTVVRLEVDVPLVEDSLVEGPERFQAQLAEITTGTSASVNPRVADVIIQDNDGSCVCVCVCVFS